MPKKATYSYNHTDNWIWHRMIDKNHIKMFTTIKTYAENLYSIVIENILKRETDR